MMLLRPNLASLALVACHVALAVAQAAWQNGQFNTTMCYWKNFRAAVVRDTVYVDGGVLSWRPGFDNGTYGPPAPDLNPKGYVYTLNYSTSFNASSNISALMGTICKGGGNCGAVNNLAPTFYGGAMLADDDEWFLYGGSLAETDGNSPPAANQVLGYEIYQQGSSSSGGGGGGGSSSSESFDPGFVYDTLPSGLTSYLAYSGYASAPSENKAWVFSGMRAAAGGPIYDDSANASLAAAIVSDTLLTFDTSVQQAETWANDSLPSSVPGRAGAELVWVPVGSQGILVALGGVVDPDFTSNGTSSNVSQSEDVSPGFMSAISIYDVASEKWYNQPAPDGPGQLTRGCAVVGTAQDGSSYNIYYYGGYDGLRADNAFSDDVWILSLPSFMWMKVSSGTGAGRAGHRCFTPYPDQMMVVGGYTNSSASPTCLEDGIVRMYNLTSAEWMDGYDPALWSAYGVPPMIYMMIGGSAEGSATSTMPGPTGWATSDLASVFQTRYATTKIATWYPYSTGTEAEAAGGGGDGGGGGSSHLGAILGSIIGAIALVALGIAALFWRRHRLRRRARQERQDKLNGEDGAGTDANGSRVATWVDQHGPAAAAGAGSEGPDAKASAHSADGTTAYAPSPAYEKTAPAYHEMDTTEVALFEMMDTSQTAELDSTGPARADAMHHGIGNQSLYASGGAMTTSSPATNVNTNNNNMAPLSSLPGQTHPQQQQQQHPASPAVHRPDSPVFNSAGAAKADAAADSPTARTPLWTRNAAGPLGSHPPTPPPKAAVYGVGGGRSSSLDGAAAGAAPGGLTSFPHKHKSSGAAGAAGAAGRPMSPRRGLTSPRRRSIFVESREDMEFGTAQ